MVIVGALVWVPDQVLAMAVFVGQSLIDVAPLIVPGIVLAAWITASGGGVRVAGLFNGRVAHSIVAASLIGAITPVCGVTVLPLMAGLLASGVPLAPVMAFWLSSPITDPAMLAATAATLGVGFALGKTVAAFGLGLLGGFTTAALAGHNWTRQALRNNRIVGDLGRRTCCGPSGFDPAIWATPERRTRFWHEAKAISRLILICLVPAFAAEHVLNALLQPQALAAYVGADAWWAVPFAVFVGAPAYLDGMRRCP